MATREPIKDWTGKILGFVDKEASGKKTLRDFYGRILGTYDPQLNVTREFSGRVVAKGDVLMTLLR